MKLIATFQVVKATKTLGKIEAYMTRDQGARYRKHLREFMPQMEDAYREDEKPFRKHLGASLIGRECERELWYGFRWAKEKDFPGRVLRLFNRGHLEEARFLALLAMIDCELWTQDQEGKQFRISLHGGHYGGSIDGVALGIPDLPPNEACLLEFKTHNDKSFTNLVEEGVRQSKFEHYAQMQQYMANLGLRFALYLATNKNNDDLYGEIISYDEENAKRFSDRALRVIGSVFPPDRIANTASWYKCRFCDYKGICHRGETPARNCRSCVYSRAQLDGTWICTQPLEELAQADPIGLSENDQFTGCVNYKQGLLDPEYSEDDIPF